MRLLLLQNNKYDGKTETLDDSPSLIFSPATDGRISETRSEA